MKFLIITHVVHIQKGKDYFAYAPYVNEMNVWLKYVDKVTVVAPLKQMECNSIHQKYNHDSIEFIQVPEFSFINSKEAIKAILVMPLIFFKIVKAMFSAQHIHLRCPGNMGLLGSVAQVFFPKKSKTAKYAGNWDSNAKQPLSYKLQKTILSATFWTKNMQVLVYGEWKNQTKNIKSFFTATYLEEDKITIQPRSLNEVIQFIFVGTLAAGKQPLYAIQLVQNLKKNGFKVQLDVYGEGKERNSLQEYINQNNLERSVTLKGNFAKEAMKKVYQNSHFLILPSKSEGWPKVVAEAMFWGCLPIVTPISCVPAMLDNGARGIIISEDLELDCEAISKLLTNQELYNSKINEAINWSRNYTIDKFELEIKKLVQS